MVGTLRRRARTGIHGRLRGFYVVGDYDTADQALSETKIGWPILHIGPDQTD